MHNFQRKFAMMTS